MGQKNTFHCRGCGKPFLESAARKNHENHCGLVDAEQADDRTEPNTTQMEDQDQQRQAAPDARPETASTVQPDVEPQPPERLDAESGDVCQCCGADVGNTTRSGLCYGCELAGCSPDSNGCSHRRQGDR